ncbi:type I secretion system permease/ATPase [Pseudotabrizicola sediminis]|uniref:Type I secretion system permease/ATPase n=1 Tax=Pseudotabrizicola sediminis TaxID=2486418 RepID=A0ABY2KMU9_9RHOB|nr:type I secretion system permease/ATPase [Pseudotabrizicola sediminis]TGD43302.1 type I secretion system permease/ATPase [Pseudotabrizicola sediminis]
MKFAPVSAEPFAGQLDAARSEFARAARETRGLLIAAVVFSVFVNLLMLTGPLYMLQVYDRVLGSRSEATLVALSLLALFLFLAMGLLDHARARLLARVGMRLQARLDRRVFTAALARAGAAAEDPLAVSAQRDLEAMQRFWTSPLSSAVMDLPWTPLFLAAIFIFHPLLGWLALGGGAILVLLAVWNQISGKGPVLRATASTTVAEQVADRLKADAEVLRALGMVQPAFQRWAAARGTALTSVMQSADLAGRFSSATRTLRMMLQSAILGLGAWLVLQDQLSAGAMIAASIIMGRALAPIEQAVGHWAVLTRARDGRARLLRLLSAQPPEADRTALPRPRALLEVKGLSLILPGTPAPVLRDISFRLEPGQALGIIGPSGAGKSTLGRAIVGAVQPLAGQIRLDGADLTQYDPDILGRVFGYLPQAVSLFDATVAENIARLDPQPDAAKVVAAAKAAAAHDMILQLPKGYDTPLSSLGGPMSGGQIQRIGLARALYGDPVLLVLDEPNSNLDNDGSVALNAAIRQMKASGGGVIVIAHRPAAIQECDLLLMLEDGQRRAFGRREDVLRGMVRNHTDLLRGVGQAGMS